MIPQSITAAIARENPTAKPGFYCFKGKDKQFFFYFMGKNREILLHSKAYASAKSAQSAFGRIQLQPLKLHFLEETGNFSFSLLDGNQKTLASGPGFKSAAERDQAAARLESQWLAPGKATPKEEKTVLPVGTSVPAPVANRHSFRLDFYKGDKDHPVRGRIEYLLTQEKVSFDGIHSEAIEKFIRGKLRFGHHEAIAAPAADGLELQLLQAGTPVEKELLPAGQNFEVNIRGIGKTMNALEAFIHAKSLASGQNRLIGRQTYKPAAGNTLTVNVLTNGLDPGMYRLTAILQDAENLNGMPLMEGNRLMQLV